jgi:hypothetical protein
MLRHVALVRTDVSKERIASVISVTRMGELTLMMEAIRFSETSVLTKATRRNVPEDGIRHSHSRENHKSYRQF